MACFKGLHNKSSRDLQPLPIYCTPRSKKVLDLQQNWCAFLECTAIVVAILPLPNSFARRIAQVRHKSARPVRFKEICCVQVKAGLKEYDAQKAGLQDFLTRRKHLSMGRRFLVEKKYSLQCRPVPCLGTTDIRHKGVWYKI